MGCGSASLALEEVSRSRAACFALLPSQILPCFYTLLKVVNATHWRSENDGPAQCSTCTYCMGRRVSEVACVQFPTTWYMATWVAPSRTLPCRVVACGVSVSSHPCRFVEAHCFLVVAHVWELTLGCVLWRLAAQGGAFFPFSAQSVAVARCFTCGTEGCRVALPLYPCSR